MKIYVARDYDAARTIVKIAFDKRHVTKIDGTYVNEYETVDEPDDIFLEDSGFNPGGDTDEYIDKCLKLPDAEPTITPAKKVKEMFDKKFQEEYVSIIKLTNEAILGLLTNSFVTVVIPKQFYDKFKIDLEKAGYTITRIESGHHYNIYFRME